MNRIRFAPATVGIRVLPVLFGLAACGRMARPDGGSVPLATVATVAVAPSATAPVSLSFASTRVERRASGCGEGDCAIVLLDFPEFGNGLPDDRLGALNQVIRDEVSRLAFGEEGDPEATLEAQADRWLALRVAEREALPEAGGPWTIEVSGQVLRQDDRILSLSLDRYTYIGGAHPATSVRLISLALPEARALTLESLLAPDGQASLTAAGERAFRAARGLGPDETLSSGGFTFEGDRFSLNQNLALTAGGLRFHFNADEVGPYALGPTVIDIPWSELSGALRAEFLRE